MLTHPKDIGILRNAHATNTDRHLYTLVQYRFQSVTATYPEAIPSNPNAKGTRNKVLLVRY